MDLLTSPSERNRTIFDDEMNKIFYINLPLLSPSAPSVRHRVRREDDGAEFLLLRPVGAGQRCGGRPEQGEPLHLVQHRQPGEHHHVPHQGETWSSLCARV